MAELTKNFGLTKPLPEEFYDVNVFNENMDILDTELADLSKIPVTSEVPEDADIWIDPDDEATEETHIMNKNNPHGVTAEQIGAVTRTLLWENENPDSEFPQQVINVNFEGFDTLEVAFRLSNTTSGSQHHMVQSFKPDITFGNDSAWGYLIGINGDSRYIRMRNDKVRIVFGSSYTEGSINDNYTIPYRIYGIKGVK